MMLLLASSKLSMTSEITQVPLYMSSCLTMCLYM